MPIRPFRSSSNRCNNSCSNNKQWWEAANATAAALLASLPACRSSQTPLRSASRFVSPCQLRFLPGPNGSMLLPMGMPPTLAQPGIFPPGAASAPTPAPAAALRVVPPPGPAAAAAAAHAQPYPAMPVAPHAMHPEEADEFVDPQADSEEQCESTEWRASGALQSASC